MLYALSFAAGVIVTSGVAVALMFKQGILQFKVNMPKSDVKPTKEKK